MNELHQKEIKKITRQIVKKYKPKKIILFGSFGREKSIKDSDVDLLIIKKTKKNFPERCREVAEIIDGEIPVDILVRTPAELKKRLNLGDFFYQNIIQKDEVLYE